MRSIRLAMAFVAVLAFAGSASAQSAATATSRLAWDQAATSAAAAQAYTEKIYADGATVGVDLSGVVCTGTVSPYQCSTAFPAFTPGSHSVVVSATNAAGESSKSAPLAFTFVIVPSTPTNLHLASAKPTGTRVAS